MQLPRVLRVCFLVPQLCVSIYIYILDICIYFIYPNPAGMSARAAGHIFALHSSTFEAVIVSVLNFNCFNFGFDTR